MYVFSKFPEHAMLVHHHKNQNIKVIKGSPMTTVCVGGVREFVAAAQIPPFLTAIEIDRRTPSLGTTGPQGPRDPIFS